MRSPNQISRANDLRASLTSVVRRHRTRPVNYRLFTLLVASVFWGSSAIHADEKLWTDNKLTPAQPFPAKVCAVATSWVGYHLLLEEIGGTHRLCIVRVWFTAPLEYIILDAAKGATPEWPQRTEGWTYITPGIDVNRFSWSIGIDKIGQCFGDEDILRKITTPQKAPAK